MEKIVEPEKEECKLRDALPVVGVIALAVAVGAYLYKKKPWKVGLLLHTTFHMLSFKEHVLIVMSAVSGWWALEPDRRSLL